MNLFRDKLIQALGEGILLSIKYGLLIIIFVFVFNYVSNIKQMIVNGQVAAQLIQEYQTKGWLPKLPIPEKQ